MLSIRYLFYVNPIPSPSIYGALKLCGSENPITTKKTSSKLRISKILPVTY
jgi:hypothetical protein